MNQDSLLQPFSLDAVDFSKTGARLSLSMDVRAKAGVVESNIMFYEIESGGIIEHAKVPWKVVSITHTYATEKLNTYALGEDGQVKVIEKEMVWDADISSTPAWQKGRGPVRRIRGLGDYVYVVGMGRQVYRLSPKQDLHAWEWLEVPDSKDGTVVGFETIASVGDDLVCAGWRGEIWRFHEGVWKQEESGTKLLITDMTTVGDTLYACGLGGLILRNVSGVWETLPQDGFTKDLFSIVAYEGQIFLASLTGFYTLVDGKVTPIDFGDISTPTTAHTVCLVEGGIAACGAKDMLIMQGGVWRRLE